MQGRQVEQLRWDGHRGDFLEYVTVVDELADYYFAGDHRGDGG